MRRERDEKILELSIHLEMLEKYFSMRKDEKELEKQVDQALGDEKHLKYASYSGVLEANYKMLRDDVAFFIKKSKQIIGDLKE